MTEQAVIQLSELAVEKVFFYLYKYNVILKIKATNCSPKMSCQVLQVQAQIQAKPTLEVLLSWSLQKDQGVKQTF